MKCIPCCIALLLLTVFSHNGYSQKTTYPKTLLWRISGNSLKKPSYLFGTMHLEDRRLFMFGDSLYRCLERAEGFAMEVDPDSAMMEIFRAMNEPDTTRLLSETVSKKQLDRIRKSSYERYGVAPEKITRKQAWMLSREYGRTKKSDDMNTPVDTYLYNIAKRQGKWVGGIEDLQDQFNLSDEWGAGFDVQGLVSNGSSRRLLDKLMAIYLDQDLNAIYEMTNSMDEDTRDEMLIRRNFKMCFRMDSMARIRSNFFAVGAAHLPGNEGLIELLQKKGFTVEPIFSSKKIRPETYTYEAAELKWYDVQDKEKTYTVKMPGKSYPFEVENALTMETYSDMGSGLIFLATSVKSVLQTPSVDTMLVRIARNITGKRKVQEKGIVELNGLRGVEAFVSNDEYWYRLQGFIKENMVYMTVSCATNKNMLRSDEVNHFHQSLIIHEPSVPKESGVSAGWRTISMENYGLEIEMPGAPERNTKIEAGFATNPETRNWNLRCFTFSDEKADIYYMLYVRETKPGFYLMNDTLLFGEAKRSSEASFIDTVLLHELTTFQGYPAMKLNATYRDNDFVMQSLYVNRGSRSYILFVIGNKKNNNQKDFSRFLESFKLTNYPRLEWSQQPSPANEFSSWAPSHFTNHSKTGAGESDKNLTVLSSDSISGYTFAIDKEPIAKYYWTESDSAFFAAHSASYIGWQDSVIERKAVQNGAVKGMEYVARSPVMSSTRRFRLLPYGDTLYVLYAIIPGGDLRTSDHEKFFTNFRFTRDVSTNNHLVNKTARLLTDLKSKDSATFYSALEALPDVSFSQDDLPLLHPAMLVSHGQIDSTNAANRSINTAVSRLADTSTVSFIKENYSSLAGRDETLKYGLLSVLARIKTAESYKVLTDLIINRRPPGNPGTLRYCLVDSLQLTAASYPEMLKASGDSVFISILAYVANDLLDSNLISINLLRPYREYFHKYAGSELERLKNSEQYDYEAEPIVELLGWFNDDESNNLLQLFLQATQLNISYASMLALIKNNQKTDPRILLRIAADKGYRRDFYSELERMGKLHLFPSLYASQKSIAESSLYSYLSDENDVAELKFLSERTLDYKGQKQQFLVFRTTFAGDEPETYLGIVGPFSPKGKNIITYPDILDVYSDEPFDPKKIDSQLRAYLKLLEEDEINR